MRYKDLVPKQEEPKSSGVPDWILNRRFLLLLALPVYLVAQPTLKAVAKLFEPAPVERNCFGLDAVRPYKPRNEPFSRDNGDSRQQLSTKPATVGRLIEAIHRCTISDCPAAERDHYRYALRKYATKRAYFTRWHDMEFGEAGLVFAAETYSTSEDAFITREIKARWEAGWFTDRDLSDVVDIVRLTATKPVWEVLPCRDRLR